MADRNQPTGSWSLRARQARDRGDADELLNLLNGSDRAGRLAAVANLDTIKEPRVTAALVRSLRSRDERLRIGALNALASLGETSAVPYVHDIAVEDDSFGVRVTAMSALAALGDSRAVSLISAVLQESDVPWPNWYRKWAAKKLVELGNVGAIEDLQRAKRGAGPIARWHLNRAIRTLRGVDR